MPPPQAETAPAQRAPNFYVTARKPLSPAAVLLAVLTAAGGLSLVAFGMNHGSKSKFRGGGSAGSSATGGNDDDRDDPSQVDYVVIGDPADAPEPVAHHRRGHAGSVHPTILVKLPRSGAQWGLIPSSPAGHLLYGWLAAFNQASAPALAETLPGSAPASTVAAQLVLRQQTGGYNLLSAVEVEPGLIAFRLRDQTPAGGEALGTLQMRPGSSPPAIASFSLRAADAASPTASP